MPHYKYSPLDPSAREIRLLILLPDAFLAHIRVRLVATQLIAASPPAFEALSYVWGSIENAISIHFEGGSDTLTVTPNLAAALQHLRYIDRPRTLWVDAICVNQQDMNERSQQVERMCDIYKLASRVIVWLGLEQDDSNYALKLMASLGCQVQISWLDFEMSAAPHADTNPDLADERMPLPYGGRELLAMYNLLHRSWFERLWIRQEIQLAKPEHAIVVCGFEIIKWESFRNSIGAMSLKRHFDLLGPKTKAFQVRCQRITSLCDYTRHWPLEDLIHQSRFCKCSDPRDRIYAVLNLVKSFDRDFYIKPDYTKTTTQVYEEMAISYIRQKRQLDILCFSEMQDPPSGMPSWIPNWEYQSEAEDALGGALWASGGSVPDIPYLSDSILKATGVCAGTIKEAKMISLGVSYKDHISGIQRLAPSDVMNRSYIGGGSIFDAYCRTLCADQFCSCYEPPLLYLPKLHECQNSLRSWLMAPRDTFGNMEPIFDDLDYLDKIVRYCTGRTLVTTEEGYIGLGPKYTRPGDIVSVLLGGNMPFIFRPMGNSQFQVVGACYIHNLMCNEAFLGPIPSNYEALAVLQGNNGYSTAFRNIYSGEIQTDDPRLHPPPVGTYTDVGFRRFWEHRFGDPRLLPEAHKARGLDLKVFELI